MNFSLVGNASAVANTSLGTITLDPIKVDVPTSLEGLDGLRGLVVINSVDVSGGNTDYIILDINGMGSSCYFLRCSIFYQSTYSTHQV